MVNLFTNFKSLVAKLGLRPISDCSYSISFLLGEIGTFEFNIRNESIPWLLGRFSSIPLSIMNFFRLSVSSVLMFTIQYFVSSL